MNTYEIQDAIRNYWSKMRADLSSAIRAAGLSDDGIAIDRVSLDSTWGELQGVRFSGVLAHRAAVWFKAWIARNAYPLHNYKCQPAHTGRDPVEVDGGWAVAWAYFPCE